MIQGDHTLDGRIIIWTAKGRLTFPEIRARMYDVDIGSSASRVLCDLTRATVADLSTVEIEELIKLIGQKMNGSQGGKSAIVVHGSVDYGLARMFSTFSELAGLPVQVKVFRTEEVAREWLYS